MTDQTGLIEKEKLYNIAQEDQMNLFGLPELRFEIEGKVTKLILQIVLQFKYYKNCLRNIISTVFTAAE